MIIEATGRIGVVPVAARAAVGVGVCVLLLAGCGSNGPVVTPSPTVSTPSPDPTQTVVDAAIAGYHAARQVQIAIAADPQPNLADYPASLKITDHLTGQALDAARTGGADWAAGGWKEVTTIAGSAPTVKSVDLATNTVVLTHCPLDEQTEVTIKGEPAEIAPASSEAKPPYLRTYTIQLTDGLWKLAEVDEDVTKTCTGDS